MRNSNSAILRHARVALEHRVLDFDRATHGVHDAAELHNRTVAGALDHTPLVDGDGGIDQVAAQGSEPRESAILVSPGESAEADDVRRQDRRKLSSFAHHDP